MKIATCCFLRLFAVAFGICALSLTARADVTLLGVQYRADQAFPEHECFWHESQFPGACSASAPLGGSLHVFLRNNGASDVTVQDATLSGMSLTQSLVIQEQVVKRHPASIYFAALTPEELQTLLDAGEPVWWKADPPRISPGETTQIVIRLRQTPVIPAVSVDVLHTAGTLSTVVPMNPDQPRVAGVSFSSDLTKTYLYWRRSDTGLAPTTILFDGEDVTAMTTTRSDGSMRTAVTVLQLAHPLIRGSFHVFQGVYADGTTASAGVRVWVNEFIYGMWGAWPGNDGDNTLAQRYIQDVTDHNINAQVVTLGSAAVQTYIKSTEGKQFCANRGLGFVIDDIEKWGVKDPLMYFIRDEPDAADSRVLGLAGNKMVGSLAQSCVEDAEQLRSGNPTVPTALNLDMTYKPYNWYNYGQVPDVLMSDPYYQNRLREAYWDHPERIPLYSKATYIYAVAQLAQSSGEPNPLHVVLNSTAHVDPSGAKFPFPTPESKRIEVYYALAGGAKGLSYWWYIPGKPSNGVGAGTAKGDVAANALWQEIGLLGAEVRTAGPVLVTSTPAPLAIQSTPGLWTRSLISGVDTAVVLAVNDQYYNDPTGIYYTQLTNAGVTVDLPSWIQSPTVFEVGAGGISDVGSQLAGNQLHLNLGTVKLTRMIIITSNTQLRAALQQRFDQLFKTKVCALAPTLCPAISPPSIAWVLLDQTVSLGGNATFHVQGQGAEPLCYQWQKNKVNIADGGPYSGAQTAILTITGAGADEVAQYRCAVGNANGSFISNEAWLDVLMPSDDSDGDHVLDGVDNCRFAFNPDQIDADGNGLGDCCDQKASSITPCGYVFSPAILAASASVGGPNPPDQTITISHGVGSYTLSFEGSPAFVSAISGTTGAVTDPVAGAQHVVSFSIAGLSSSAYLKGTIRLTPTEPGYPPAELLVRLALNPAAPAIPLPDDDDSDGVHNDVDNCPALANGMQTDLDADRVGDICDNCLLVWNEDQADDDHDGIGNYCDNCRMAFNLEQADADADGVGDTCDNCPAKFNPDQRDSDGDGVGDVCDNCITLANARQSDTDGDAIGDSCDNCLTVANPGQQDVNSNGVGDACEPKPQPVEKTTPPPAGQTTPPTNTDDTQSDSTEDDSLVTPACGAGATQSLTMFLAAVTFIRLRKRIT